MAITSLDTYIGSTKQYLTYFKTASITAVAAIPFTTFHLAGVPGAGTLAVGNTSSGIVPTDALAGYPDISAFTVAGYLGKIDYAWTVPGRLILYDCLFSAGAYAYNADVTLTSQPDYSGRVPAGTNYGGIELWLEQVTAMTGNQTIQINYLDQDGEAGDTGAIATGVAPIVGRMYRVGLALGDHGVSQLVRVRSTVSSAGTFNVHIMRPLWTGRVIAANFGGTDSFARTGLKPVYATSALRVVVQPDSTATALPQLYIELCDA
jgi:hypothetical protein